ncbi:MAG: hypothetical protein IJ842_05050 [Bacilli bacterium]|nr:hypothetical protein [Bacilli bacterium]
MKKIYLLLFGVFSFFWINNVYAKNLYDTLNSNSVLDNKASEFVASDTGIDFLETSSDTNGKGLYKIGSSASDKFPILYFRGDIDNNHVVYAGFCWRIIRTTKTGGIKLLYAGVWDNNSCSNEKEALAIGKSQYNDTNSSPKYGWTYLEDDVEKDSVAKTYLDNWYKDNMTDYTRELEDTVWCNDRRMDAENNFIARTRLEEGHPDLSCEDSDSYTVNKAFGNGKLTYPTGIINADEVTYAGEVLKKTQTSVFVNISYSYWSMTPYTLTKNMYPNSKGMLNMYTFTYNAGIRPMVALRNTANYYFGDGSRNNPYIIEVEKQYMINNDSYSSSNVLESEVGDTVEISAKDRDGYMFTEFKLYNSNHEEVDIPLTKISDTKYQFSMPLYDVYVETNYRVIKDFYDVTSNDSHVEIDVNSIEEDQIASFRVKPDRGFSVKSIKLLNNNGDELAITPTLENDLYTFTMPGENVLVEVEFLELPKYIVSGDECLDLLDYYFTSEDVKFKVKQVDGKDVLKIEFFDEDDNKLDIEYTKDGDYYSFKMIDKDVFIKVTYIDKAYINPETFTIYDNDFNRNIICGLLLLVYFMIKSVRKKLEN